MFNGSSIYGDFRDVNVYQRVELAMAMGHPLWDACKILHHLVEALSIS